jgi:sugar lactone lactonase YvrE
MAQSSSRRGARSIGWSRPAWVLAPAAAVTLVLVAASPGAAKAAPTGTPIVSTVAGNGTAGYSGDKALATAAELNGPCGVAVDKAGNVLFSDTNNNVIRALAETSGEYYGQSMTAGDVYTIAGDGTGGYIGDGGPPTEAQLETPDGLSVDAAGDVVISDTGNYVVRFIPATSSVHFGTAMVAGDIYTVAGNTEYGFSGAGGQATSAELGLDVVTGVAIDKNGNLIISDGDNNVIWAVADTTGTFWGQSMTAGDIYIIAGNDEGNSGYKGNGVPATKSLLDEPEGLAVDSAGNIVFADDSNDVVRVIADEGGKFYGKSMKANDIYTVGPKSDEDTFNSPEGLSVDAAGNIVFADAGNNVIYLIGGSSGTDDGIKVKPGKLYTIAGNGDTGYTGDGGNPMSAEFNGPCAVAGDAHGNFFIADGGNNVIREITLQTTATVDERALAKG